jgi:hypothetical protein
MIVINNPEEFQAMLEQALEKILPKYLQQQKSEKLLTVEETIGILKVSSRTLNRLTKSGDIRSIIVSNRPKYEESEVQRYILNHKSRRDL